MRSVTLPPFRFYLISNEDQFPDQLFTLAPHLASRHLGLQIREKYKSPRDLTSFTEKLLHCLPPQHNVSLFINDRADLALNLGLSGVHLREDSCELKKMHPVLRQYLSVGISTHSLEGVLTAEKQGADFVVFGPVFPTTSHPERTAVPGIEGLRQITDNCKIPVFALGGITPESVEKCMKAGAYGIAAISGVWGANDPLKSLKDFLYQIERSRLKLRNGQ
ncbi:MAG: thiamine phosphate synthase [SAR324 cluster bacterium]|nr:thiamine phosphate synthase [SAR324 cluster bacterium]